MGVELEDLTEPEDFVDLESLMKPVIDDIPKELEDIELDCCLRLYYSWLYHCPYRLVKTQKDVDYLDKEIYVFVFHSMLMLYYTLFNAERFMKDPTWHSFVRFCKAVFVEFLFNLIFYIIVIYSLPGLILIFSIVLLFAIIIGVLICVVCSCWFVIELTSIYEIFDKENDIEAKQETKRILPTKSELRPTKTISDLERWRRGNPENILMYTAFIVLLVGFIMSSIFYMMALA